MDFGDNPDPAADFLAREQDQLAEIGDDIIPATQTTPPNDDLFAASPPQDTICGLEGADGTPADFGFDPIPVAECGDAGTNFQPDDEAVSAPPPVVPAAPTPAPRQEPEKIRRWREEQKKRLEEKDAEEERKKSEWREAAKKELEDWYKQHEESVAKTRSANRAAESELVAGENQSTETAANWEQIAKLCEFNPKVSRNTKDTSRMRSLILQLKQNPPAKAAKA